MAVTYNVAYFYTFGDSVSFFLYTPVGVADIIKTGAVAFLYVMLFFLIFKNIFVDPVFNEEFPGVTTLLVLSILVFVSNLFYFLILDEDNSTYYLLSELVFFASSLVAFFGILYFFSREQSKGFLAVVFLCSLFVVAFFVGWLSAKFDIKNALFESKSKILLEGDKIVSAKILRSFNKGILVMLNDDRDINFISWDQIKEAKFKKVTGF